MPRHDSRQGREPVLPGVMAAHEIGEWVSVCRECVDDSLFE
jgi:hypothetical protein